MRGSGYCRSLTSARIKSAHAITKVPRTKEAAVTDESRAHTFAQDRPISMNRRISGRLAAIPQQPLMSQTAILEPQTRPSRRFLHPTPIDLLSLLVRLRDNLYFPSWCPGRLDVNSGRGPVRSNLVTCGQRCRVHQLNLVFRTIVAGWNICQRNYISKLAFLVPTSTNPSGLTTAGRCVDAYRYLHGTDFADTG